MLWPILRRLARQHHCFVLGGWCAILRLAFRSRHTVEHFTPFSAIIGGLLIGLATSILWVANGRAAGISTIAGGIFPIQGGDVLWRVVFVIALPIGGAVGFLLGPMLFAGIPTSRPVIEL